MSENIESEKLENENLRKRKPRKGFRYFFVMYEYLSVMFGKVVGFNVESAKTSFFHS